MIQVVLTRLRPGLRAVTRDTSVLAIFTATIFLSALLLFSVQPIFAKMVLPKLGGTPAVWAVSMCFFQAALLAGYCYAHALDRWVGPRVSPVVHVAVLASAYIALPFGLPAGAEPPAGDAYLWLIQVLAVGVGLPFFSVSANAPLLQAWFARTGHPQADDPYFLYGASNVGSLLALLSYPLLIEPQLGLASQATVWTGGFVLLAGAIVASAMAMVLSADSRGLALDRDRTARSHSPVAIVTMSDRLGWIGLAFVPSGLLVAYTTHLTTDVASAPFLWVLPLAAFLATFIVVFRDTPLIPERVLQASLVPTVGIGLLTLATPALGRHPLFMAASAIAVVMVMLIAHRALYLRRPTADRLTEFYIWMSLGGVLGGVFTAMVAPHVFSSVVEYPLLLVLALGCRPHMLTNPSVVERRRMWQVALAATAGLAGITLVCLKWPGLGDALRVLALTACLVAFILWRRETMRPLVLGVVALAAVALLPASLPTTHIERSFFGVHRVLTTPDGQMRVMFHGTTVHGAERITVSDGRLPARPVPATYYYPGSALADGFDVARDAKRRSVAAAGEGAPGLRVGVVGLGAGSLACIAAAEDSVRFFEIDPVVVKIASTPAYFRFLSACRPNADIVVGDARLTVAKQPAKSFDYLVIDAFSSDAVPVHLLTAEALAMYADRLSGDGLLALHVSNQFMDLDTVAAVTAATLPGVFVKIVKRQPPPAKVASFDASGSWVVFVTRDRAIADRIGAWPDAVTTAPKQVAPWTDDFSDVVGSIVRGARPR